MTIEDLTPAQREEVQVCLLRQFFGRRRREIFRRNAGDDKAVQQQLRRRFRRVLDKGQWWTTATIPPHPWPTRS